MDVLEYFNAHGAELVGEFFEGGGLDGFLANEAEEAGGFEFGPGAGTVAGVDFADSDFDGCLEEGLLVFFGDALEVVLLHLVIGELKVEVDVEGAYEDFIGEVGLVVEVFGLLVVGELDLDDAVLAVDRIGFDIGFLLAVLQEHVDHLVLQGLLHILDY